MVATSSPASFSSRHPSSRAPSASASLRPTWGEPRFEVQLQVLATCLRRVADELDLAVGEQHRTVAVLLDRGHVVGDEDDRLAFGFHLVEGVGALLLEGGVADRQHLVDQQDVGVGLHHHREGEPDQHARGVVLQLQVGELAQLGEVDHRVEAPAHLLRRQPHHHPVEDDVLAGGQLVVEADAELDERRQAAGDPDRPAVGPVDARQQLQQGALAGAVAADDPEELALVDLEGDAVERVQLAVLAGREGMHRALFEGVDALGRDPEGLVEILDLDRERRVRTRGGDRARACDGVV